MPRAHAAALVLAIVAALVLVDTALVMNIRQLSIWYGGLFPGDAPGPVGRAIWDMLLIVVGGIGFPAATAILTFVALRRSAPAGSLRHLAVFLAGAAAVIAELWLAPQWIHGIRMPLPNIFFAMIEGGYLIAAVVLASVVFTTVWFSKRVSGQRI